eukprot:750754_1
MVVWTSFISYRTNKLFNTGFQRFGEAIYKKPWLFIIIGLLLTAIAGSGLMVIEMESSVVNLWVPQSSQIYTDYTLQQSVFGSSPTSLVLLFQGPNNQNVFTPSALSQASDAMKTISDISIEYNDNPYTFHDLCARVDITSTECIADHMNIHSIFFADTEAIWSDQQYIDQALNHDQMVYFAGNLHHDGDTVSGANVMRVVYELTTTSDEELSDILIEYEKAFTTYWATHNADYSEFDVLYYTSNGFDDELWRTVVQDSVMFLIAFGVMLVYLQLTLGGISCIHSRPLLATSSIFILICALIFGFGISGYLGMKFSTLVFVVPFLLLGVGVDDMIIIVDTLNRTPLPDKFDKDNARAKQLGLALQHSGVSISLTSFCSVVAFAVGSITDLPGLEYFCMFAALSFLGMYILQFLLFVPLLVYDNERIFAHRNFCCPCIKHAFTAVSVMSDDDDEPDVDEDDSGSCGSNALKCVLDRTLVKILSCAPGRVLVIVIFIGITALSVYLMTKVQSTSDVTILFPDESYIADYYDLTTDAWPGLQPKEIELALVDIDIADADVRRQVYELINTIENVSDVEGHVDHWLEPFTSYLNYTKGVHIDNIDDQSTFYSYLMDFEKDSEFNHWEDELVFDDEENPTQISTRFYFHALQPSDELKRYDSYLFYNGLVDEVMGSDTQSFMMQDEWTYFYLAYALRGYTLRNLIIASCAVLLILIFLMDMCLAILIMCIILCIDVCLFGWMYLVGIDLQVISFAQLCMAVGLTVDYVIHMVHAIAAVELEGEDDDDGNEFEKRNRLAMLATGSSVSKGAFTTFLGASVLAFSNSYAFRSFFVMLTGIIIIASLFGLVVAPALMGQFPCIYSRLAIPHPQTDQSEGSGTESAHATPGIGYNPLASHSIMQTAEDLGIEKDDDEYSIELSPIRHDLGEGQEQTTTEEISMELII